MVVWPGYALPVKVNDNVLSALLQVFHVLHMSALFTLCTA